MPAEKLPEFVNPRQLELMFVVIGERDAAKTPDTYVGKVNVLYVSAGELEKRDVLMVKLYLSQA